MPTVPLDKKPKRYYEIEAMIAEGASIRKIIRDLGVDFYTIKEYFPGAGQPSQRGGRPLKETDPERYAAIGRMVAQGCSLNEIMRTLGTDHRTIKRAFPNAGWKRPGGEGAALMKKGREILEEASVK